MRSGQRGFSIVAAIFLIVVLAVLGAALLTVSGLQHSSSAADLQGARALQAARAGAQWGMYRILDPDGAASAALPVCWAGAQGVALDGTLAPFTAAVSCVQTLTTELDRTIGVYQVVATASAGAPGTPNHVQRQVQATVSRCKNPLNGPDFEC